MSATSAEVRQLRRQLEALGYTVTRRSPGGGKGCGGGHWRVVAPDGRTVGQIPSTPKPGAWLKRKVSDLRRAGVPI